MGLKVIFYLVMLKIGDIVDVRQAFGEFWRNLTFARKNLKEGTEVVDGITEHINNAEDMHNKV